MRTKIGMRIYLCTPSAWARMRRQKCPFRPCGGRRLSPWSPLSASVRSLPTRKHLVATNARGCYPAGSMMVRPVCTVTFEPRKALLRCQRSSPWPRAGHACASAHTAAAPAAASRAAAALAMAAAPTETALLAAAAAAVAPAVASCAAVAVARPQQPRLQRRARSSTRRRLRLRRGRCFPGALDVRSDVLQPIRSSTDGS